MPSVLEETKVKERAEGKRTITVRWPCFTVRPIHQSFLGLLLSSHWITHLLLIIMTSTRGRTSKAASIVADSLSMNALRQSASWIRDVLDPLVSREGPQSLSPNDVLTLHSLLLDLQTEPVSTHVLRNSRIYLAVLEICGKATRWPGRLIDEADEVLEAWEDSMGPVKNIRTPLYEKGGRLYGICEPQHTEREVSKFSTPKLSRPC